MRLAFFAGTTPPSNGALAHVYFSAFTTSEQTVYTLAVIGVLIA
jgi:hypothetical protein